MTKPPDWQETLDDLDRRRQHTWAMGGPERLTKHRDKGKLDARARIEHLLDPGTFREIGTTGRRRDRRPTASSSGPA